MLFHRSITAWLSVLIAATTATIAQGFVPVKPTTTTKTTKLCATEISADGNASGLEDDTELQWDLFKNHHAKGSWKGVWTSYNYIGDVIDETVASVDLNFDQDRDEIQQTHTIVVGAKKSDCATCFDSMETKTLPVATYNKDNFLKKSRFGAISLVNGPSLLRSGAMSTELVLSHKDSRLRVLFQHAPVWEQGVEPGTCPPQGLKLFRTMISREALRDTAPTAETEAANPPTEGSAVFYRPVPPFNWHKKWGGTSWTWGPSTGNRGWRVEEMEETDAWHGITPVDAWNLRLPGGIFVQAPRVVTDLSVGLCRLAWLPDDETLLRVEAGVQALKPMVLEDDTMVGFEPPSLTSLRCDMMQKMGELENVSRPSQDWNVLDENNELKEPTPETIEPITSSTSESAKVQTKSDSDGDSGLQAVRDALSL